MLNVSGMWSSGRYIHPKFKLGGCLPPEVRKRLNRGECTGSPTLSFRCASAAASAASRAVSNVPMGSQPFFAGLYGRACHHLPDGRDDAVVAAFRLLALELDGSHPLAHLARPAAVRQAAQFHARLHNFQPGVIRKGWIAFYRKVIQDDLGRGAPPHKNRFWEVGACEEELMRCEESV